MKIAVLCGGISPERNVSLAGGRSVVKALNEKGHDVIAIDPALGIDSKIEESFFDNLPAGSATPEELAKFSTRNIIDCINSELFDDIDLAFLVLHGQNGEDGKIQSLLQLRGIPYTGSGIKSSALAMDKISSKMMFLSAGIPTPRWVAVHKHHFDDIEYLEMIRDEIGNKMVIKPNDQGSTIGIQIVLNGNLDDIQAAIIEAGRFSNSVIVEEYIEGREITVGVVGDDALPIIEIVPEEGFYDYEHKYSKGRTEYLCPAELTEDVTDFTQNLALTAFSLLGCTGFGRADFRLDEDNQAWLLEMNTIPGFTDTSLVPKAAKELGIEFADLCEDIINIALEQFGILSEENEGE